MNKPNPSDTQSHSDHQAGELNSSHAPATATTTPTATSSNQQQSSNSSSNYRGSARQPASSASRRSAAQANEAFQTGDSHSAQQQQQQQQEEVDYADASRRLLMSYGEDEIAEVRAVLAAAGYPTPSDSDLLNVLEQAQQLRSADSDPSQDVQPPSNEQGRQRSWEDVPRDAMAERGSAPPPPPPGPGIMEIRTRRQRQQHQEPVTREPSPRPAWDASTRLQHSAAEPEQEKREAFLRHGDAVAAAAGRHRGGSSPTPHFLQAHAASSKAPLDSPAALLHPSTRLQRYVRYYERALRDSHRRHPALAIGSSTNPNTSRDSGNPAPPHHQPFPLRPRGAAVAAVDARPARVLEMALRKPTSTTAAATTTAAAAASSRHRDPAAPRIPSPPKVSSSLQAEVRDSSSSASTTAQRRAANLIYDKTGDPRYRYNLLDLDTVANNQTPGPCLSSARLRRLAREPQVYPRAYNPCPSDRHKGRVLTTFAVRYVDTDGSTLPTKTDPVARGQQMRTLWSRDEFLENQARRAPTMESTRLRLS